MRRRSRGKYLFFIIATVAVAMLSSQASAFDATVNDTKLSFHGFLESNFVLRDVNGFEDHFMDEVQGIQQRNTLKFDVNIVPTFLRGDNFSLDQIHMTFRGAYDSIFNLRDYEISKDSYGRFDYGLDDIKYESDLREAFLDLTYRGELGTAIFRPGRQLVSWGESDAIAMLDIINPPDNSFQMFFLDPQDLKTPLWMARLNYAPPPILGLQFNLDMLYIPDIRPTQFAPFDDNMQAPYNFIFEDFAGINVRQDVPTHESEYGIRLTADIGYRGQLNLVYFRDVVNDPAIVLTDIDMMTFLPASARMTHPKQHVYGGFFSYDVPAMEIVIRGEFSHFTNAPIALPALSPDVIITPGGVKMNTFRLKPRTNWLIGVDKNIRLRWLSRERTNFTVQYIGQKINAWEDIHEDAVPEQDHIIYFFTTWNWWNGRISPQIAVLYSTEDGDQAMTNVSAKYVMSPSFYSSLGIQAFWGDEESQGQFAPMIGTSEVTFKLGYQW